MSFNKYTFLTVYVHLNWRWCCVVEGAVCVGCDLEERPTDVGVVYRVADV